MNKTELVEKVAEETGVSRTQVKKVIDATNEAILKEVMNGGKVTFVGLWTFYLKDLPGRSGKIPGSDKTYNTPPSQKPAVKVSDNLRMIKGK